MFKLTTLMAKVHMAFCQFSQKKRKDCAYLCSLHNILFNLPTRGTCANGILTSPPYQDNFFQGLDQRLK
jgi:hypothetical protein